MSKQTDLINIPDAITVSGSNVGIGTSSPAVALEIIGTTTSGIKIKTNSAHSNGFNLYWDSSVDNVVFNNPFSGAMLFETANTERMRITSTGNVGIGTSSPASPTGFGSSGILHLKAGTGNDCSIVLEGLSGSGGRQEIGASGGALQFYRGSATGSMTESMRIDSSGNLFVGKTSAGLSTAGVQLDATGSGGFCRAETCLTLSRLSTDGSILDFRKDSTTVGSIGTYSGTLAISSANTGIMLDDTNNILRPTNASGGSRDGIISLGNPSQRFKNIYTSGGIYLGGTVSANALDDYEEGEFGVSLTTGSGSATLTAGGNTLAYTKVGRIVTITGQIRVSSTSSPGGDFSLTLPFASASGTGECVTRGFAPANLSANLQVNEFFFELSEGTAVLNVLNGSGTTVTSGSASSLQGNTTLGFNFSYRAT
jgi:hypothetical protein